MITKYDNFCLNVVGLANGTTAGKVNFNNAVDAVIAGRAFRKAITADVTLTAHPGTSFTSLVANQSAAFFLMADSAGAITTIQSSVVPTSGKAGWAPGAWEWPDRDGYACVGAFVIAATGAWVPATTTLTGNATYVNVAIDYGRPINY